MKYEKINLRALEPEDLELLYEWENNNAFWTISNTIAPFSKFTLKRYLKHSHKNIYETGQLRFMIELPEEKLTIGTIDLFDFDPYHNRAGVGILIGDKSDRKKGYASLAMVKFLEYSFNTLQLHQLYCNITAGNTDSLRLFKRCGFKVTGRKVDWVKTPGKYLDEYLLQLINPNDMS